MATRVVVQRPFQVRARRWALRNLFSSPWNSVLTVATLAVIGLLGFPIVRFVLVTAEWDVVQVNRQLIFLGRYPSAEEWRLWPPLIALTATGGLAMGLWMRLGVRGYATVAGTLAFLYLVLLEGATAQLFLIGVVLAFAGYAITRTRVLGTPAEKYVQRTVIVLFALLVPFTIVMLQIGGGVRTSLWGGLMLNVMLATVGIAVGFPVGIVLALGRASSLPMIRWTSTAYIELVRAAPLVAWLFMARFVMPDFLPPLQGVSDLDLVVRAMIVLAGFTGAYVAEIVRGGLQSLPRGQQEAAHAIGLGTLQTTWLIVLPQALRAVIPALVGQFISLWKDTTLVFALGLTDLLGAGKATLAQIDFIGRDKEIFLFIGLMFWAVSFGMSRLSQRVERQLGVGER